jgi:hypothetical protein
VSGGRPSLYNDTLADEICQRVVSRPLHQVAKDDDMPSEDAIYTWLGKHKEFAEKYARARQLRAFRRAESVDAVVEDMRAGRIGHNEARVAIDAIKWQTGKENPKAFGDRLELAGDANAPLTVQIVRKSDANDSTPR